MQAKILDTLTGLCYYGVCTIVVRWAFCALWPVPLAQSQRTTVIFCCIWRPVRRQIEMEILRTKLENRGETSMEKSRIRPVPAGKSVRMSYSRQKEVLEMPNLIEIQKDSYQWFLKEGLKEAFDDISPIADFAGHLSLEFVDFTLCKDDIKYTIEECKERDATYAAPLKVKVRLYNKDKDEMNEHEIFMGDLPLMTDTGSFVINGAERVIVSQLVRSPGIYYGIGHDKVGKELYTCTVIPNRGAWLEYETDSNDVFYVRVDRTRKVPVTVLIRALGFGTNAEILELFGEEPKLLASFGKDTSDNYQDGLLELYKKIRPGEPLSVDSAESLLNSMFFDPRRYDLAKVGRYKFNKKLSFKYRPSKTETVMINRVLLFDRLFLPFLKAMCIFGIEIDSSKQPALFD